jgi:hypothetical protein
MTTPSSTPTSYLTTEELAAIIKYDARTIRNRLKDSVLLEGIHYIRPFGGRKILFIREAIERDIGGQTSTPHQEPASSDEPDRDSALKPTAVTPGSPPRKSRGVDLIPMAGGGVCHV